MSTTFTHFQTFAQGTQLDHPEAENDQLYFQSADASKT